MGVINWKEAAPADQAEELQLSVEQALRSAAPLTAPVPVWADGPDSEHLDDDVAPGFAALRGGDGALADISAAAEAPVDPGAHAALADWLAPPPRTPARARAAHRPRG